MQFQPIERLSAATECATALRRAILSGELSVGQKLPPERRLAEQFGVNRLTLRAALSQLVAMGLVSVRQGSGYTVADVARVGGPDLLPEVLAMAAENGALTALVADLLRVRRALASTVLQRLAEQADVRTLAGIQLAVDEFERVCNDEQSCLQDFVHADFAIVSAMVDGIHSPIIRMCINPVLVAVAEIEELAAAMYTDPRENLVGHRQLLQWIENPELAPLSFVIDAFAAQDEQTLQRMGQIGEQRAQDERA
jgi:GntR family transcriptional regulator, transcriptional repressor for pyruvate dehydrogenase complex